MFIRINPDSPIKRWAFDRALELTLSDPAFPPPECDPLCISLEVAETSARLMAADGFYFEVLSRGADARAADVSRHSRDTVSAIIACEVRADRVSQYFDRCECGNAPNCIHFSNEDRGFLARNPEYMRLAQNRAA